MYLVIFRVRNPSNQNRPNVFHSCFLKKVNVIHKDYFGYMGRCRNEIIEMIVYTSKGTSRIIETKSGNKPKRGQCLSGLNCMPAWSWPHFSLLPDFISIIKLVPLGIFVKETQYVPKTLKLHQIHEPSFENRSH